MGTRRRKEKHKQHLFISAYFVEWLQTGENSRATGEEEVDKAVKEEVG